jgi:hypothetical protein
MHSCSFTRNALVIKALKLGKELRIVLMRTAGTALPRVW